MFFRILFGIIARILNVFIPVQKKHWAFSADNGNMYREGSKYLLEFMLKNHPDYKCTFFTQNKLVYQELKNKGIPCIMNISLRGIIEIAKCEAVFTTQSIADIRYAFKKSGRKYYYLLHGMPLKKAGEQLKGNYVVRLKEGNSIFARAKDYISEVLTLGYTWKDISFLSSCSEFLSEFLQMEHADSPIKILGMPRNDALLQPERMTNEKWVEGINGKFIITYMPTHRGFGTGEITPTPFISRPDIQQWMRENNVVLLMKNHPNMIPKLGVCADTDVIKDVTKLRLDPQVCLYHTDVLITDFSSVWMDYLLLRRPVLFYIYDDFESDDVGTYYDIRTANIGHFCYDENALFELIKKCRYNYKAMVTAEDVLHKYHKYVDGNSCKRYFDAIIKDLN